MSDAHDYEFTGLRVRSCIPIPGLPGAAGEDVPDVEVRPGAVRVPVENKQPTAFWVEDGALTLAIRGIAGYRVAAGREIVIDAVPGARREDLLLYLMGSVFGALWIQRGLLPLHASVVDVGHGAIAFSGWSGAGKSSLAAFHMLRGHRLVNDDKAVVAMLPDGRVGVWPGAPYLKLGRQELAALGKTSEGLEPAGGTRGKFQLPVEGASSAAPIPLRRFYVVKEGAGDPWVERLTGLGAIDAVAGHTYCRDFVEPLGRQSEWFQQAVSVSGALEVRRLVRPLGFEHMDRVMDVLESDWRD